MLNKLINKQLFKIKQEIKQGYELTYNHSLSRFKLESGKNSITVIFIANSPYVLVVDVNDNIEYLNKLFDVQVLYLLYILKDKLKNRSFSDALRKMLGQYKKIQETIERIKENENSTN